MAFPVVQTTSNVDTGSSSTTPWSPTMPTGITAGDLLVVVWSTDTSVVDPVSVNAGWTALVDAREISTAFTWGVWWKVAEGSDVFTITQGGGTPRRAAAILYRISGQATSGSIIEAGTITDTTVASTSAPIAACTPTGGAKDYLWLAVGAPDSGTFDTLTAGPTSFTNVLETGSAASSRGRVFSAERELNASTLDPDSFTLGASEESSTVLLAIHPAGATGYTLTADPGAVTITGTAAGLLAARRITADSGSVSLSGTAASLEYGRRVAADSGSVSITGTAATLRVTRRLTASAGSVAITGTAATLRAARTLTATAGAVTISGTDAGLIYSGAGYRLTAEPGAVSIAGTSAGLRYGRRLAADSGTVTVTGTPVSFRWSHVITALSGSVVITGTDAQLVYGTGEPPAISSVTLTGSYQRVIERTGSYRPQLDLTGSVE